jgi:hypothetical protein
MGMLPAGLLSGGLGGDQAQARTKKYLCMLDSMTNDELDGKVRDLMRAVLALDLV